MDACRLPGPLAELRVTGTSGMASSPVSLEGQAGRIQNSDHDHVQVVTAFVEEEELSFRGPHMADTGSLPVVQSVRTWKPGGG